MGQWHLDPATWSQGEEEERMSAIQNILEYFRLHGIQYTVRHGMEKLAETYLGTYDRCFKAAQPSAEELAFQKEHQHHIGLISVLIPVYRPRPVFLQELLESLLQQTEEKWEACFYHTGDIAENKDILDRYAEKDARIRVQHANFNEGISGNTNRAFAMAKGAWIALCDHDDLLAPHAFWLVADILEKEQTDIVYTDEDKITENGKVHTDPHLKPDFSPDTLCSSNYICHLLVFRRELMEQVGGERSAFDGSQDHDLMLRLSECSERISHVHAICYHWRTVGNSASHTNLMRCLQASCRATEEHMGKLGFPVRAVPEHGVLHLEYSIQKPLRVEAFVYGHAENCMQELQHSDWDRISVTQLALEENRWMAYEKAAAHSEADVLLFVDSAVEHIPVNMVRELLMYAQRDDVGAVTPALTDRRGHIRHAGFAYPLDGFAQCLQEGVLVGAGGWHNLLRQAHNVGAVSGACFMIRRDHWIPFDTAYQGGLAMVDWCIRLGRQGLHHVYTPHGAVICRPSELLLKGTVRHPEDLRRIEQKFGEEKDPCYHPAFRRNRADFHLDSADRIRRCMH